MATQTDKDNIRWFKENFGADIQAVIADTPFKMELIVAIALQETGYLWGRIRKYIDPETDEPMTAAKTLELCVGDSIGAPKRGAFPKTAELLKVVEGGDNMFDIARDALKAIGQYEPAYKTAYNNGKFCHGFGIFQYDLQFFKENPSFFLEKKWYDFDECLILLREELYSAMRRAYGANKKTLTNKEMVYVAIAYNAGSVDINDGFQQGHMDDGKYYGEHIWEYLQLARSSNSNNPIYKVIAKSGLKIRSGPGTNFDKLYLLPFGSQVSIGQKNGDWVQVDKDGENGVNGYDGYSFADFLELE
jgi:Bacterial SH3 domain